MSNQNSGNILLNRELSILHFNERVLAQALDETIPLLERLQYVLICNSNLDEFFEIRVANLKHQISAHPGQLTSDGYDPRQILMAIHTHVHALVARQYKILNEILFPALETHGIRIIPEQDWDAEQASWLRQYFRKQVLPLVSPIALDPAHPFPKLVNKSMNFIVLLSGKDAFGRDYNLAVVQAPRKLPRFIRLPDELCETGDNFVYLSSIISANISKIFPGMAINGCHQFRITRDSDFSLDVDTVDDLPKALQTGLFSRRYGHATRLEIDSQCPKQQYQFLLKQHGLSEEDLYLVEGQVNLSRSKILLDLVDYPELRFPTFEPSIPLALKQPQKVFARVAEQDILLNHPFQGFDPIVQWVRAAANDPDVLAIKVTLYRTGADSPMISALAEAALAGKEVTAVVELQARFDEADNIALSNRLQSAGALVVYGVLGYKTHTKMLLMIRREFGKLARYAHLSTGNYHASTAKVYVDFGLLTRDKEITHDVQSIFNQLTGMGKAVKLKRLLHAPFTLAKNLRELIDDEIIAAKTGNKAHIIAKMNALTDPGIIQLLYQASQAGVKIELMVRGACCLRPGVKGLSENISVRALVGRFLEHARVYYFYHDGDELLYLASADWMTRNLYSRVEICYPILDPALKLRLQQEALQDYLQDNQQTWLLQSDGCYKRIVRAKEKPCAVQPLLLKQYQQ